MKDHAGRSISVWMATATLPSFSKLLTNEQAHVCIIGAGIAGLTTAYLLGRTGKSVIVLDDGPIVSGETERTTAHLVTDCMEKKGRAWRRKATRQPSAKLNKSFEKNISIVTLSDWTDIFSCRLENPPTSSIEKWPPRSVQA